MPSLREDSPTEPDFDVLAQAVRVRPGPPCSVCDFLDRLDGHWPTFTARLRASIAAPTTTWGHTALARLIASAGLPDEWELPDGDKIAHHRSKNHGKANAA